MAGAIATKFKNATRKDDGVQALHAAAAATLYVTVPSLLKLNGWAGMAVGFLSAWGYGVLMASKGAQYATFGIVGAHLWYTQGQGLMQDVTGGTIWAFDSATVVPGGVNDQLMSYPDSSMIAPAMNDIIPALPGGAPSPGYSGQLSGYGENIRNNVAATTQSSQRFAGRGMPELR